MDLARTSKELWAVFLRLCDRVAPFRPLIVFLLTGYVAWLGLGQKVNPDFSIIWTAERNAFGPVYDVDFITAAQAGVAPQEYPRPFGNPPTFLLAFLPFGLPPFQAAYVLWVALGCTAFVEATNQVARRFPALVLGSPLFMLMALSGETTMYIGALFVAGVALIGRRPILAGVLLGLGAAFKPQMALFIPLGLIVAGEWRTLFAAGATGLALVLASAAVFGIDLWFAWVRALPGFVAINNELGVPRTGQWPLPVRLLLIAICAVFTWRAFRGRDVPTRLTAAIGSSIICSPHAPLYEATMLMPAAIAWLYTLGIRTLPSALLLLSVGITAVGLVAYTLFLAAPWPTRPRKERNTQAPPADSRGDA